MSYSLAKVSEDNCRIKVIVRFRPLNDKQLTNGGSYCVDVLDTKTIKHRDLNNPGAGVNFTFDRIFDQEARQVEIYEEVGRGLVKAIFDGINGTMFAYGQTSSGKTHTCLGPSLDDKDSKGIIPRIIDDIFLTISDTPAEVQFRIKLSIIQIYMQKIRDLLDPYRPQLKVRQNKTRGVYIQGVTEFYVSSAQQVLKYLHIGASHRTLDHTNMNESSSRSHMVFTLTLYQNNLVDLSARSAKLTLIDLAGSEKVCKSGVEGKLLDQAKQINKSLSALGNVINALTESKIGHIPYRDSKLTRILQQSLGGNAKTNLILNCSPCSIQQSETLSTLRFGSRAKNIKNSPKINREYTVTQLILLLEKAERKIQEQDKLIRELFARCKTQGEREAFLALASGAESLGSLVKEKEKNTIATTMQEEDNASSLTDEDEKEEKEEAFNKVNNLFREDLVKALEQEKQEKTIISRNYEVLKLKFERLQTQFFDLKSTVNLLEKQNQTFNQISVKQQAQNKDLQQKVRELQDTVGIYNDGLKNMVESADSMKRDASKMFLNVSPQRIKSLSKLVRKISISTQMRVKRQRSPIGKPINLQQQQPSNLQTTSNKQIKPQQFDEDRELQLNPCSLQELDMKEMSEESAGERCARLQQEVARLRAEREALEKIMAMDEAAKAKRILALENYLVNMSTDFYLLKGQEYRWKTDHTVFQNQLKRKGDRIHYLQRQLQKAKQSLYLLKVKYDQLAISKSKDQDLSDLNIDFTQLYPKPHQKRQLNIVKVLKSSTQKINQLMSPKRNRQQPT